MARLTATVRSAVQRLSSQQRYLGATGGQSDHPELIRVVGDDLQACVPIEPVLPKITTSRTGQVWQVLVPASGTSRCQAAASRQFSTRSTRKVFQRLGPRSSIWNHFRPG